MLIALDQASKTGYSVWDDDKLINYGVYDGSNIKDGDKRISQIKEFTAGLIDKYNPAFVVLEDIQLQYGNVKSYKFLAKLLGVLSVLCVELSVKYDVVNANTWRSGLGLNSKNKREVQKLKSIKFANNTFGLEVSDDNVADAICLGYYAIGGGKCG